MKRPLIFFILSFAVLRKAEGGNPESDSHFPLAIACNTTFKQCLFSDAKTLDSDLSSSKNPRSIKILRCCPDSSDNRIDSMNTLVIADILRFKNDLQNERICKQPYRASVLTSENNDQSFHIGYAISKQNLPTDDILLMIPPQNADHEHYYWFSETRNIYDTNTLTALRSKHRIFPHRHSKREPCPDYSLGIEKFKPLNEDYINKLYSPKNQTKALKNVVLKTSANASRGRLSRWCDKPVPHQVIPHQLIPIDDFLEDSLKFTTCSYLNTVPLWKSVAEGAVKLVENYIREIADIVDKTPLNIWTEIYYEPTDNPIYLDDTKKLRVPSHFIKIISYPLTKPSNVGSPEITLYYIAIVVHNETNRTGNKICREIVCQEYGWHVGTQEGGLTYCCELDDLKSMTNIEALPSNQRIFDLYRVPVLTDNRETIEINAVQFMNGEYHPLTIVYYPDTKTYKLTDLQHIRDSDITEDRPAFSHIILCCPPKIGSEEDVIRYASKLENSLFIKGIYRSIHEIPTNYVCEFRHQPTAMYSNQNQYYLGQPGFEMGYVIKKNVKLMEKYELPDMRKFQNLNDYFFISEFWIAYNQLAYYPILSVHTIIPNMPQSNNSPASCNDMTAGIELLDEVNEETFDRIYSKKNQKNVLRNFSIPKELFVPYQLVPIDDFQSDVKYTTCSYLNVTPVFKSIAEGPLRAVENTIRSTIDDLNNQSTTKFGTFEITTVASQVLQLPLKKDPEQKKPVFLHISKGDKLFPVPKFLMKIVAAKVELPLQENQEPSNREYKIYAIVIVIHNELKPHSWRICINLCPGLQWPIENPKPEEHLVYCCSLGQIQEMEGFQSPYGDTPTELLNLNMFF